MELDTALAPLVTAYGLKAVETETNVSIRVDEIGGASSFDWDTATSSPVFQRYGERPAAGRLHLAHSSFANAFQVELAEAQSPDGDPRRVLALELPMSFSEAEAERVAEQILADANSFCQFEVTRSALSGHLEVGATIELEGKTWAVVACERGLEDMLQLAPQTAVALPLLGVSAPLAPNVPPAVISPDLLVIDGPRFGEQADPMVTIASFADPWPGRIDLLAGDTSATQTFRALIDTPSLTGRLTAPLAPGVLHRWDEASTIEAEFAFAGLSSADPLAVLSGANMLLVETTGGWECLSFRFAELIGPSQYRLSGLLRGQKGTDRPAQMGAQTGARCVVVDDALVRVPLANDDVGRALFWRLGDQGSPV
ncbi:MAG: phage tail protein [Pseudomonadota bacterium]